MDEIQLKNRRKYAQPNGQIPEGSLTSR